MKTPDGAKVAGGDFMTIHEAAARLGVSVRQARNLCRIFGIATKPSQRGPVYSVTEAQLARIARDRRPPGRPKEV